MRAINLCHPTSVFFLYGGLVFRGDLYVLRGGMLLFNSTELLQSSGFSNKRPAVSIKGIGSSVNGFKFSGVQGNLSARDSVPHIGN